MFRVGAKRALFCAIWPFSTINTSDIVKGTTETERKVKDDFKDVKHETGWERVKNMFKEDEFGEISREISSVTQVACMSIFVGAVYGGINSSKETYIDFIKNNQATAFKNPFEAKRKLRDTISLSFAKGAFKWSWRLCLFSTSFVGIYTLIQVYRNKCGVLEYIIAGSTTGALYKFNMGPRGWVVGAGLGSVLGLIGGGLTNLLLSLAGMSMDEVRFWQTHWKEERRRYTFKKAEELREKEQNTLLYNYAQSHDESVTLDKIENKE